MNEFVRGIKRGFPICLGYIPVSFTFGLIAVKMGFSPLQATLISLTNMASAGQFAGIRLIEGGAAYIELIITTFVINLRYFLMSLSLSQKVDPEMPFYKRAVMAYCITDEVFALAAMEPDEVSFPFFGGLMLTPILGWTSGTLLGAIASNLLSPMMQGCMGIALYCMFIAIIIPPARKSRKVALAVVVAAALSCIFKYVPRWPWWWPPPCPASSNTCPASTRSRKWVAAAGLSSPQPSSVPPSAQASKK